MPSPAEPETAPPPPTKVLEEHALAFEATVESVGIATAGTGAWVVDFDARWVVGLLLHNVSPQLENVPPETTLQPGKTYHFAIHSPARLFHGHPGGTMVGKRLRFTVLHQRTTRGIAYDRLERTIR